MREYDLIADWYATDRRVDANAVGIAEVQRLASTLAAGASVLDVGCGNGLPLTMLANPDGRPPLRSFRRRDLLGDAFPSPAFRTSSRHSPDRLRAKKGGKFRFTSGDKGTRTDDGIESEPMSGVPFHYWSLTPEGYRELLREHGLTLLDVHRDEAQNTYYLAEKVVKANEAPHWLLRIAPRDHDAGCH